MALIAHITADQTCRTGCEYLMMMTREGDLHTRGPPPPQDSLLTDILTKFGQIPQLYAVNFEHGRNAYRFP